MNRTRTLTTGTNRTHIPLRTQNQVDGRQEPSSSTSASRRRQLNIVTQDVIEEYLQKADLDMKDENDSEVIIKLLKKPTKNHNDVEIIMKVFNKISFFQDLQNKIPNEHIRQLIKEFKYESKEKGDVVFQYGELGINYFILLKGSLYLLLPKSTLDVGYGVDKQNLAAPSFLTEPNPSPISNVIKGTFASHFEAESHIDAKGRLNTPKPTAIPGRSVNPEENKGSANEIKSKVDTSTINLNSHISPSSRRKFTRFYEEAAKKKSVISLSVLRDVEKELRGIISQTFPDFEITKRMEAVVGFGEIALMSNLKRTATIVCREACHLVTLSKSNYEKILKDVHENIVQSKIDFMKNYSFFSGWNTSKMLSLWELLRLNRFPKNSVIFKEGDEAKSLFFVKSGEIEISKIFDINEEPRNLESYLSKENRMRSLNDINLVWADARWRRKVRRIKLALLGPGTYFGEEEVLLNVIRNRKAVVVSASAEIYKCPKEKFFAYVKTIHNLQFLKDDIQMKNEWRDKYVESIRKISEVLLQKQRQRSLSPCYATTQSPRSETSTPKSNSYRRKRVTSFVESKPDLSSLIVLEKLEKRYSNILKLKKTLDCKTDRQRCDENTMFLNSLFEDRKKKFMIVTRQEGNVKKLIGVVRDIFPKRGKSLIQKHEKSESRKKNFRSLSIDDTLRGKISHETAPLSKKKPEFINGRKLKSKLFKILRLKSLDSTLICQGAGYLQNSYF